MFALHLAHLDPSIDKVFAVALPTAFKDATVSIEDYLDQTLRGVRFDSGIGFHTFFGAKVLRVLKDYRPEDVDNQGIGVLVQYDIRDISTIGSATMDLSEESATRDLGKEEVDEFPMLEPVVTPKEALLSVLKDIGIEMDEIDLAKSFFDYGITSNQLDRINNSLKEILKINIPQTAFFDYPSVQTLSFFLERELTSQPPSPKRGKLSSFLERELTSRHPSPKRQTLASSHSADISMAAMPINRGSLHRSERPREMLGVVPINLKSVLAIHTEYIEVFERRGWQRYFAKVAKETYPDMVKYAKRIKPSCESMMGKIIRRHGHLRDGGPEALRAGLVHVQDMTRRYSESSPTLRRLVDRFVTVMRFDAPWGDPLTIKSDRDQLIRALTGVPS